MASCLVVTLSEIGGILCPMRRLQASFAGISILCSPINLLATQRRVAKSHGDRVNGELLLDTSA